jgi:uncharacterized repeat protein (TIGR01451 family)
MKQGRWALAGLALFSALISTGSAQTAIPSVSFLGLPTQAMIGENFQFGVTFRNTGTEIGYGPFVDLLLPAGGIDYIAAGPSPPCPDTNPRPCDGITYVGIFPLVTTYVQDPISPCTLLAPPFAHPYDGSGVPPITSGFPGMQVVTVELPFGSFPPNLPEYTLAVGAHVSELADPLQSMPMWPIMARGGFRYGLTDDETDQGTDPPIVSENSWPVWPSWQCKGDVTPVVFSIRKEYLGLEDETATGLNYLRQYAIFVDIANGQTVTDLKIKDFLAPNAVYQAGVEVHQTPYTTGLELTEGSDYDIVKEPPTTGPVNSPYNELSIKLHISVTGTPSYDDIWVLFNFYVPEVDANGQLVIDPADCVWAKITNNISAEAQWLPADCRDQDPSPPWTIKVTATNEPSGGHILDGKCLAIQKTVDPVLPPIPGDVRKYTLDFQVSDYETVDKIEIDDYLSDGQALDFTSGPPTLVVEDQFGRTPATGTAPFTLGDDLLAVVNQPCTCKNGAALTGAMKLTFNVSKLMKSLNPPTTRPGQGILTGGWAVPGTPSTTPATGQIVFYVKIQDMFSYPQGPRPGDPYVDKLDPLNNCVTNRAEALFNAPAAVIPSVPNGAFPWDHSQVDRQVRGASFEKSIYAITRGGVMTLVPPNAQVIVGAGDQMTFRITMTVPSGDVENLVIRDWPPLPVCNVDDPDADGTGGYSWPQTFPVSSSIPPPGSGCFLSTPCAPVWSVSTDVDNNMLVFVFGSFNDPYNLPCTIDLLFTLTVSSDAFAKELYFANVAQECEDNTFTTQTNLCRTVYTNFLVGRPILSLTKGIVATDNPNAIFSEPSLGTFSITPPGDPSCPRFSGGTLSSSALPGLPRLRSDLGCLNPGDHVTFAIVLENIGHAPSGAYDVQVQDTLPSCFSYHNNLCVHNGAGTVLPWVGNLLSGLELTDTALGALGPYDPGNGLNIAVITFDATYVPLPGWDCCTNRAELLRYSNEENGTNYVTAFPIDHPPDEAVGCGPCPPPTKCIVNTSEPLTLPDDSVAGGQPQVAIGEIVRFRLIAPLPQGTLASVQVEDTLPAGLSYLGRPKVALVSESGIMTTLSPDPNTWGSDSTVRCSSDTPMVSLSASAVNLANPQQPLFDLGQLVNNDVDANSELVVLEFNALVDNVAGNQACVTLTNTFQLLINGLASGPPPDPVSVQVVEPNLVMEKSVDSPPATAGDPVKYVLSLDNLSALCPATGFDVHVTDPLPQCLSLDPAGIKATDDVGNPVSIQNNYSTPSTLDITLSTVLVGQHVDIECSATFNCDPCTDIINLATVTWSSLPGDYGTPFNPTGSTTPGLPGAGDGERNGSGGLNDYSYTASASLNLCPDLSLTKAAEGTFMAGLNGTFILTVQNVGNVPVGPPVTVTDIFPPELKPVSAVGAFWDCIIDPNNPVLTCTYQSQGAPVLPGDSFEPIIVTVSINGSSPATVVNYAQVQMPGEVNIADNTVYLTVPVQPPACFTISNEEITCNTDGTYTFKFDLDKLPTTPEFTATQVEFSQAWPAGVTFTPNPVPITPLTASDLPQTVSVTLTGPGCGTVCFLISIYDAQSVNGCTADPAIKKCLVLPPCDCVDKPSGMVGWWTGDGTADDHSGWNNHGQLQGGATYAVGEVDLGFGLNAAGDYVLVPNPLNNSLDFGDWPFTIDAWIKTVNTTVATIVDKRFGPPPGLGYCLRVDQGKLVLRLADGTTSEDFQATPLYLLNDGAWHHVAAVVDRTQTPCQVRMFVDGKLSGTSFTPMLGSVSPGPLLIGQSTLEPPEAFAGCLDEVEIFRRALSDPEVIALWQAGCAGKCKCVPVPVGLVDWWPFESAIDYIKSPDLAGAHNNQVYRVGGVFQPGQVNNALCFDGVDDNAVVQPHDEVNFRGKCGGDASRVPESYTIDAWVRTDQDVGLAPILDKREKDSWLHYRGYALRLTDGKLEFLEGTGPAAQTHTATLGPNVADNNWHFIAVSVDRCVPMGGHMYVDEDLVHTFTPLGGTLSNPTPLLIGRRAAVFGGGFFRGCLDEIEITKRALSANELRAIWRADQEGKCLPPLAIVAGPVDQVVSLNDTATFTVVARGDTPMAYQWFFDNASLAGATNATQVVPNVQPVHLGNYYVVVSNVYGMVTSQVATLILGEAPVIVSPPQNQIVLDNRSASFTVAATGTELLRYQWRQNGLDIPGAIDPAYTTPRLTLADDGARFSVVVVNDVGSVTSPEASVTVVIDTVPPTVVAALAWCDRNQVIVTFDELVDPIAAQETFNYELSGGLGISSIRLLEDGRTVCLFTDPITPGGNYTVTVSNVRDLAGNPMPAGVTVGRP